MGLCGWLVEGVGGCGVVWGLGGGVQSCGGELGVDEVLGRGSGGILDRWDGQERNRGR